MALTTEQMAIVKSTAPILEQHGTTITKVFYENMLADHPELNNIFNKANQDHLRQPRALAAAVYAYAKNIDNLDALTPTIQLIANKHASMYVQPEHYAIVGEYLIGGFKAVLGDALTPEILDAWGAAYAQLADIFINKEKSLYANTKGWTDWQDFRIAKKIQESDEITSFYLEPIKETSKPLPPFLPGQFISIQTLVPELRHNQTRQYSLSDAPAADHYRLSIKKDSGADPEDPDKIRPGLVSNIMHSKSVGDIVQVSHPMGNFFVDPSDQGKDHPLVLISAGVGLTSLMSILNTLSAQPTKRPISWIHAARSSSVRAFAEHVKDLERKRDNIHSVLFTTNVAGTEVLGEGHHEGHITAAKLDKEKDLFLKDPKTQYYICGPVQFMQDMEMSLLQFGVDSSRIHMERFGTGGVPRATA